jgi:hypothetical protein
MRAGACTGAGTATDTGAGAGGALTCSASGARMGTGAGAGTGARAASSRAGGAAMGAWRHTNNAPAATTSAPAPRPMSSGLRPPAARAGATGTACCAWIVGALPSWRSAWAFFRASRM